MNQNETSLINTIDLFRISPFLELLFKIIYYSVSVISILGNSLILFVVIRNKRMHNVTNIFITNLAFVDIIISLFSTPFQFKAAILQKWIWSPLLCQLCPFSVTINITVSILTLVVITIDRSYVIIYPLCPKLNKKHSIYIIISIWIIGGLVGVYSFTNYEIQTIYNQNISSYDVCAYVKNFSSEYYFITISFLQYIFPLIIFTITLILVCFNLRVRNIENFHTNSQNSYVKRKKAINMILTVYLAFLISWTPIQLYNIIQIFYYKINL